MYSETPQPSLLRDDYLGEWAMSPSARAGQDSEFSKLMGDLIPRIGRIRRFKEACPTLVDVLLVRVKTVAHTGVNEVMIQQAVLDKFVYPSRYVSCISAYKPGFRTEAKQFLALGNNRNLSQIDYFGLPENSLAVGTLLKPSTSVLLGMRSSQFTDRLGKKVTRLQVMVGDVLYFPPADSSWDKVLPRVITAVDDIYHKSPPWLFNHVSRFRLR